MILEAFKNLEKPIHHSREIKKLSKRKPIINKSKSQEIEAVGNLGSNIVLSYHDILVLKIDFNYI
jgi:hypothetical protein